MTKKPDQDEAKTVKCIITRDYWDENRVRHPKGKQVDVSVEEAMDGIETGALKRVKPE